MTREEAVKIFNTVLAFGRCDCQKEEIEECLRMAIKALEQEPCEDCISRQAVLDALCKASIPTVYKGKPSFIVGYVGVIETIPPVTPQPAHNAIIIPNGATNGDMIKNIFEPYKICEYEYSVHVYMTEEDFWNADYQMDYNPNWWNAPYKAESEE